MNNTKTKQRSQRTDSVDADNLQLQYEKTKAMLNNPHLKLPDGGAKLKAKLAELEVLMKQSLTDKVSGLSLNNHKVNVRQQTLERSNQTPMSTNLLRAHKDSTLEHVSQLTKKKFSLVNLEKTRMARMMSLEESMKLQESQQKDIQLANMRKRMEDIRSSQAQESLADDLAVTMNRLQLDPELRQPRPDDDGPSDEEGSDSDDDYDNSLTEGAYEDEGFEEDSEEEEEEEERQ
ncbi:hypothetical protein BD560DRAFT_434438 [Blakeslea trispora]|nr:hypothetical protein BD560DRAFT_434438 [Blakeslea trispora]